MDDGNSFAIGMELSAMADLDLDESGFVMSSLKLDRIRQTVRDQCLDGAVENLLSLLVSLLRKHYGQKNDDEMQEFLTLMSQFALESHFSQLFVKYYPEAVLNERLERIGQTFAKHCQVFGLMLHRFRFNLYPSLVGTADEPFDVAKYDTALRWLHGKYQDYLELKMAIEEQNVQNIKKLESVCQICEDCFDEAMQLNVKCLLREKYLETKLLRKQLEMQKMQDRIPVSPVSASTKLDQPQRYREMVLENHQLEQQVARLRKIKRRVDRMDTFKVQRVRQLIRDIEFMEKIANQSPESSSPMALANGDGRRSSSIMDAGTPGEISLSFDGGVSTSLANFSGTSDE